MSFLVFHCLFENRCIFLLRLRQQPTSTLWFEDSDDEFEDIDDEFEDTDDAFEEDAYHDNPSFLSYLDPGKTASPPRKRIFAPQSAESTAWKTLATILPRAAPLPALSSLLQHRVFTELKTFSYVREELRDVITARLKYLQVKKSFDPFFLSTESHKFIS